MDLNATDPNRDERDTEPAVTTAATQVHLTTKGKP